MSYKYDKICETRRLAEEFTREVLEDDELDSFREEIGSIINKICSRVEESDLSDAETQELFMNLSMFIHSKAEPFLKEDDNESNAIVDETNIEDAKSVFSREIKKIRLSCQLTLLSNKMTQMECDKKYDDERVKSLRELAKKIDMLKSGVISKEEFKNLPHVSVEAGGNTRNMEKLFNSWLEE